MATRYEIAPCPVCGGTGGTQLAGPDEIRSELEQLWEFHTRRLRGGTPPRMLLDRAAFSQEPPLRVERCDGCGLLFRNPRERADELLDTYGEESQAEAALQSLFDSQHRSYRVQARRLTRQFGRPGTGLEVGSYVGAFLAAAAAEGWTFRGVDVNTGASEFARARGLDVSTGTIDDDDRAGAYDVVAFWNCFDQLPDPAAAARAARRRLRPGGMIAVRVPNGAFYAAWRARLDTALGAVARGLLAHSNLLGFPYRHGFSTPSLARVLDDAGFEVSRVVGDALVPMADRWTRPGFAAEERLTKLLLRRLPAASSPWIEVYARAR
jgi:SAM-dependent methyltransferase